MIYYVRGAENVSGEKWFCDSLRWNEYYRQFSMTKPSSGLCAVFGVVERWQPTTIGLIGFDWVLDGYPEWQPHDADAERQAILSLVKIEDLRIG